MSIEENKEIVRRYQEAYNNQDYDALDDLVAADVLTPNMILSVPRGLEGAKQVHQKTVMGMPDYHTTIEDLIAEGDKVVARVTLKSRSSFLRSAPNPCPASRPHSGIMGRGADSRRCGDYGSGRRSCLSARWHCLRHRISVTG